MTYRGRIENGVVVLEPGANLPEGAEVSVVLAKEAPQPTIGQKLAALGRSFEGQPCDLPSDLAAQHDHYLHGLPKRS